ncbi:MAG: hypothetical protein KAW12_04865 [Candidatus Aminicenantes bacterium]|nr:hypothetical protein [Candidatus Aminicenantes bacterium]
MAQRSLTIDLPGSADALQKVLQMLLQYGLISEKKVRTLEQEDTAKQPEKKSRWAQAAERLQAENYLKGRSGEVKELFREFREDFEL